MHTRHISPTALTIVCFSVFFFNIVLYSYDEHIGIDLCIKCVEWLRLWRQLKPPEMPQTTEWFDSSATALIQQITNTLSHNWNNEEKTSIFLYSIKMNTIYSSILFVLFFIFFILLPNFDSVQLTPCQETNYKLTPLCGVLSPALLQTSELTRTSEFIYYYSHTRLTNRTREENTHVRSRRNPTL